MIGRALNIVQDRRTFLAALGVIGCSPGGFAQESRVIKAGQIGTRHSHAAGKLAAIRAVSTDYTLIGVAESNAKARAAAEKQTAYDGVRWLEEQDLLADDAVRMIAVETTLEDSTATARRVIAAGKHLHLDKPGGTDHSAFKTLRLEAEASGLIVQMGYMLRHQPAFSLLFRAAREGWLGDILEITATMGKQAGPGLRQELTAIPGHGMFELACHLVDAVVTLLGPPPKVSSFAAASRNPDDKLPDHQLAVFEYPKALATIRCNHNDPGGMERRAFTVVGTKGSMHLAPLESGRGVLKLSEAAGEFTAGEHQLALQMPKGRYDAEFVALAKWIRGDEKPGWTAEHDIAVHAAAQKAAGIEPK